LTSATIIPVSYDPSWKITLKSWDAFMIPLPFGRCDVHLGAPVTVPPNVDLEAQRHEVEQRLRALVSI
jgi:lysophospholipid acyltransferase (LPLAT)-like uncharacterized protein